MRSSGGKSTFGYRALTKAVADQRSSHYHWDHTGDPSTFPPSTDLVVGPGFKKAFTPGYPKNQDSPIRESDYQGRNLREISFDSKFQIGGYAALDYFEDGSFYLLDSPGVSNLATPSNADPRTDIDLPTACHRSYVRSRPVSPSSSTLDSLIVCRTYRT